MGGGVGVVTLPVQRTWRVFAFVWPRWAVQVFCVRVRGPSAFATCPRPEGERGGAGVGNRLPQAVGRSERPRREGRADWVGRVVGWTWSFLWWWLFLTQDSATEKLAALRAPESISWASKKTSWSSTLRTGHRGSFGLHKWLLAPQGRLGLDRCIVRGLGKKSDKSDKKGPLFATDAREKSDKSDKIKRPPAFLSVLSDKSPRVWAANRDGWRIVWRVCQVCRGGSLALGTVGSSPGRPVG